MTRRLMTLFILMIALVPAVTFAQSFSAPLTGAAEVPGPGDTDGTGFAVVAFNGTTLTYTILAQNIAAPTAAHIHTGAAGVSGDVLVNFNPQFIAGTAIGTVSVPADTAARIIGNPAGFYVNVHNADFPNGAIRGQLVPTTTSEGSKTSYLPVVGKVAGANNTNFVTDLRIVNRTSQTANVTLDFYAASPSGQTAPTATRTLTVAPGEQKLLNDVIGTTFSLTGLGALKVTSDRDVTVTARVINDLRGSGLGTTGFAVDAADLSDAQTAGTISFLSQASSADIAAGTGFRTNIGYFNPNAAAASVTFTARRTADGVVLGSNTISIPGLSQLQQSAFSILSAVPAADQVQADFYVTWTSNLPVFVYGAVVDNKTGDSVLIQ